MSSLLPWYPPAPAAGPASLLHLPPDDWALEPKIDGIRVVIYKGAPFTRQGQPLSSCKRAALLRTLLHGFDETLDGEWVPGEGMFYLFDVPDQPGDYDARRIVLDQLATLELPGVRLVTSYTTNFPRAYETLRGHAEGVVLKRRKSLYNRMPRPSTETRDWLKRRFCWDKPA